MGLYPGYALSLCSGIDGLGLGIKRVFPGSRVVAHVEIEAFACSVLAARMEDGALDQAPIFTDVTAFRAGDFNRRLVRATGRGIDLVYGGFPCTDISLAGKGAGIHGEHSGLWFELLRVIREVGPRFVFLENVAALTLRGMDTVLAGLAEVGLDAEWGCLRASDVGAPHRRDRWFCLAWDREQLADAADGRWGAGLANADARRGKPDDARGGPELGDAPRECRTGQPFIDDERRPLGGAEPGADGRVGERGVAEGVSFNGRTDSACSSDLRLALADGAGERFARCGPASVTTGDNGAAAPRCCGETVAVADAGHLQPQESEGTHVVRGQRQADRRGSLGDAGSGGVQRRGEPGVLACAGRCAEGEGHQRQRGGCAALDPGAGIGGDVGDAQFGGRDRLHERVEPGHLAADSGESGPRLPRRATPGEATWPGFPPGPGDRDGWRAFLAEYPDLAPATERPVRGVSDGAAADLGVCVCPRVDQLRALGNAVVPIQAAVALKVLWKRAFNEDL